MNILNGEPTLRGKEAESLQHIISQIDTRLIQSTLKSMEEELRKRGGFIETMLLEFLTNQPLEEIFNRENYSNLTKEQQLKVSDYQLLSSGTKTVPGVNRIELEQLLKNNIAAEKRDWQESFQSFKGLITGKSSSNGHSFTPVKLKVGINFTDDNIPSYFEVINDKGVIVKSYQLIEENGTFSYQYIHNPRGEDPLMAAFGKRHNMDSLYKQSSVILSFDQAIDNIYDSFHYHAYKDPRCEEVFCDKENTVSKADVLNRIETHMSSKDSPTAYIKNTIQRKLEDDKLTKQEIEDINENLKWAGYDITLSRTKSNRKDKTASTVDVHGDERFEKSIAEFLDESTEIQTNSYSSPTPKSTETPVKER